MGIAAGRLVERLVLQRKNRTVLESGHEGGAWEHVATVRGAPLEQLGRELLLARERNAEVTRGWDIRYRASFSPLERVIVKGQVFDVTSAIALPAGRPHTLRILVTSRAET